MEDIWSKVGEHNNEYANKYQVNVNDIKMKNNQQSLKNKFAKERGVKLRKKLLENCSKWKKIRK